MQFQYLTFNLCHYTSKCSETFAALYTGYNNSDSCRELTSDNFREIKPEYIAKENQVIYTYPAAPIKSLFYPNDKDSKYGFCLKMICDEENNDDPEIHYNSTDCSDYTVTFKHSSCIFFFHAT